jgi:hypothetical protein
VLEGVSRWVGTIFLTQFTNASMLVLRLRVLSAWRVGFVGIDVGDWLIRLKKRLEEMREQELRVGDLARQTYDRNSWVC